MSGFEIGLALVFFLIFATMITHFIDRLIESARKPQSGAWQEIQYQDRKKRGR